MSSLTTWLAERNERERRVLLGGGIAAVILLILAVVLPLDRSVAQAQARVVRKQSDLAWMRSVAPQVAAAGPQSAAPASQESLIVVVDRAARDAGLGSSLTSSEPNGVNGLRVRLEKAPFNSLVGWLARLSENHGVQVESATVDRAGEAGIVNAGVVLRAR